MSALLYLKARISIPSPEFFHLFFKGKCMSELLRDKIYGMIKRDILSGEYQPGVLLSANQLAERYKFSSTPVREALNALEQEGFIETIPRVGFFVARISIKDIRDMFEYRIVLEGASAELASRFITDEELNYISSIPNDYVMGNNESYLQYLSNNREFHFSVAKASHNQFLAKAVGFMLDQTQRLVFLGIGSSLHTDEIIHAHPRLVHALRERDASAARNIMIEGILSARDSAIEQVMQGSGTPVQPLKMPQI
jgi:DNA-binding GntR family transcriptional regulator